MLVCGASCVNYLVIAFYVRCHPVETNKMLALLSPPLSPFFVLVSFFLFGFFQGKNICSSSFSTLFIPSRPFQQCQQSPFWNLLTFESPYIIAVAACPRIKIMIVILWLINLKNKKQNCVEKVARNAQEESSVLSRAITIAAGCAHPTCSYICREVHFRWRGRSLYWVWEGIVVTR